MEVSITEKGRESKRAISALKVELPFSEPVKQSLEVAVSSVEIFSVVIANPVQELSLFSLTESV